MGHKGETTKQQILSTAFDLFAENGYSKVTMQDICDKCGLSKGGLYRYFADKPQLFLELLKSSQMEQAETDGEQMSQTTPAIEILEDFLNDIRTQIRGNSPNIDLAVYEFFIELKEETANNFLSEQFSRGQAILQSVIEYGIRTKEFQVKDEQATINSILIMIEGLRILKEVMPITDEICESIIRQIKLSLGIEPEK